MGFCFSQLPPQLTVRRIAPVFPTAQPVSGYAKYTSRRFSLAPVGNGVQVVPPSVV